MSKVIQNMAHGPNFHLTRIPIRPISGPIDFTRLNNPRAGRPEEKNVARLDLTGRCYKP